MKKPGKRPLAVLFLALAASGFLFAEKGTVNLAIGYIPHIQFAPLYVGIEKGFYAEENIDLNIEYGFGIDIFSLLAMGKIDVGLSDSDQLLLAGAKGLDLRAVFQYYQKYPVTIVAKADKIGVPADFAGRKIGTPELYGTSYIGLQLFLEKHGLRGRVEVERIGYTQISSLLGDRIAGAVCFTNNEPVQLRESGQRIVQWDVKDLSDIIGAAFLTSQRILDKKEALLRGFARATAKAMDYTAGNQDEALALSEKYIGRPDPSKRPFLKKVLAATSELFQSPAGYGHLDEEKYQRSLDILVRLGMIGAAYPAGTVLRSLDR